MPNLQLTVHYFSSEDETSWAAVSNSLPRFVLYDVCEHKLEAQVKRALTFISKTMIVLRPRFGIARDR